MSVGDAVQQTTDTTDATGAAGGEDGRTRCAWVRGRPEHYFFHDAEWGRLPDGDEACFERVLLTVLERDVPLVEALDRRLDVYEASGQWSIDALAGADDAALDAFAARGGIVSERARVVRLRDAAQACAAVKKEFKTLRDYFLVMPSLTPEEQIADVCARFPGFDKEDAARLIVNVGCVGGSIEQLSHERDCWIY